MKKQVLKRIEENLHNGNGIELWVNGFAIDENAIDLNQEFFYDEDNIVSIERNGYQYIVSFDEGFQAYFY